MIGCKALSQEEIDTIENSLKNVRDKALFILGLYTGFRIQESLSLKVSDVLACNRITVRRKNMKGRVRSRSVAIHPRVAQAISELIMQHSLCADDYLFKSAKGVNAPISRIQAWRIVKAIVKQHKLDDRIALHSTRKTFADRMYKHFDKDLLKTSKALGHKSILSTASYLSFKTEEIDEAVMGAA